jgi:hypothetical protein
MCPTDKNRMCLGVICNPRPNPDSELIRRNICNGIEITRNAGIVSIKNITEFSIFVYSSYFNEVMGVSETNVSKVTSGYEVDVFDRNFFDEKLQTLTTFEEIYKLKEHCTVYASFIKGWGRQYKRKDIISLPTWLQIKFIQPLQTMDSVLREMKQPSIKHFNNEYDNDKRLAAQLMEY